MRIATLIIAIATLIRPGLCSSPLASMRHAVKRNTAEHNVIVLEECIQMTSSPGHYMYVSPGRDNVCGLFIIGSINQIVAIEFTGFNIDCDDEGLLVVVDGWEIDGQLFPSVSDHSLSVDERYRGFCGADEPSNTMIMSQNVALIQFRIPKRLQHFRIRISFPYNPAPCNAISTTGDGSTTLSNYGLRRNCSLLFIYPELIDIVRLEVGQIAAPRARASSTRLSTAVVRETQRHSQLNACIPGGRDYVEVLGGSGLDTSLMTRFIAVCGLQANHGNMVNRAVEVPEPYTAIRLVSSGLSYNSITFQYQQLVIPDYDDD